MIFKFIIPDDVKILDFTVPEPEPSEWSGCLAVVVALTLEHAKDFAKTELERQGAPSRWIDFAEVRTYDPSMPGVIAWVLV